MVYVWTVRGRLLTRTDEESGVGYIRVAQFDAKPLK